MFTKDDIVIIGNLLDEKLDKKLDEVFDKKFTQHLQPFKEAVSVDSKDIRSKMDIGFRQIRNEMNIGFKEIRSEIDERFSSLDERLNDRFTLIDARFVALEQVIYDIREDVADLRTSMHAFAVSLDALTKSMSDIHMEYTAITIQLTRHEKWIQELADKAGIKFT